MNHRQLRSCELRPMRVGDVITAVDGVSVLGTRAGLMRLHMLVAAGATLQLERADGGPVTIVAR